MPVPDLLDVPLSEQERRVLLGGLVEWRGPARCTEEFAVAMGFHGVANLFENSKRLYTALKERKSLSQADWVRVLLMTEIVFASDVVGSGWDWRYTVGISDEETIALLRSTQRKIPKAGVVGVVFGTRPAGSPGR